MIKDGQTGSALDFAPSLTAGEDITALDAISFAETVTGNNYSANFVAASSQQFTAADSSSLSVTGNLTIESWLKLSSYPASGSFRTIALKWDTNQQSYIAAYRNTGGTYSFEFQSSSNGTNQTIRNINYTLDLNTYYHIAFVYTAASGQIEVFVNGSSIGTATGLHTSLFDSTALFRIGGDGGTQLFNGKIDEMRVWNITKTGADILATMNSAVTSGAGLVASWRFENDLTDSSGNGNTLTNVNGVTFNATDIPWGGTFANGATATVTKASSANSEKRRFVGFALETKTSGNAVLVQSVGVVSGFTGLTVGAIYKLSDTAGEITPLLEGDDANSFARIVGIAVSSTKILITNQVPFS